MHPKALRVGLGVLVTVAVVAGCGSQAQMSPYRTVEVFIDAQNHGDFRAACSVTGLQGHRVADCERFYAGVAAQGLMFGFWAGYTIVPHSQQVWSQQYRGHAIQLATVQFRYVSTGGRRYTVHLRRNASGLWRVWFIR